ncbi:MAG: cytochrome c biogenesis CcdA family protein [Acidimicrobiales bacterium]
MVLGSATGQTILQLIGSGNLLVAAALAVAAGFVSFASPCVLPLVPAYISYVSGISAADAERGDPSSAKVVIATLLFVAGFSVVFVALGAAVGEASRVLLRYRFVLLRAAGALVIVMGLFMLGALRLPALQRERRLGSAWIATGVIGAFPLGLVFGLGWTPCIGPTLSAILGLAVVSGGATRGAVLLGFYSFGLGVPFVVAAAGFRRGLARSQSLRRRVRSFEMFGGAMLVVIGGLLVTGAWQSLILWVQDFVARAGYTPPI